MIKIGVFNWTLADHKGRGQWREVALLKGLDELTAKDEIEGGGGLFH